MIRKAFVQCCVRSKDAEALENVKQDVTVTVIYKGKNNAERQRTVYLGR